MTISKVLILLTAITTLLGCEVTRVVIKSPEHRTVKVKKQGPPKHAPAHGYYKKHRHLHRYDRELDLYVFLRSPETYYLNDYYIRWSFELNRWERAPEPNGKWRAVHERKVPAKLIKRRAEHKKQKHFKSKKSVKNRRDERYSDLKDKRKKGSSKKKKWNEEYQEECEKRGNGRSKKCRD